MREIKFRGFSICNCWIYGYLDKINHNFTISDNESFGHIVDPKSIGQYTGIKDIEGKEIYEGDIVRKEFTEQYLEDKVLVGEVKMIEGMWVVVNEKEKVAEPLWSETDMNYVIGNIYENKELLED